MNGSGEFWTEYSFHVCRGSADVRLDIHLAYAEVRLTGYPILGGGGVRLGGRSLNIQLVKGQVRLTGYPILGGGGVGLGGCSLNIQLV